MFARWTRTLTRYAHRKLSKDTDKLPAIQSIAAEMSAIINDTYIDYAGMWKGNLKHDLLWQVRDGHASKPQSYRAPTWSWASLNAPIGWNEGIVAPKASHPSLSQAPFEVLEIADAEHEVVDNHFLKVKGFLQTIAFVIECDSDERWVYGSRGTFPYDIFISTPASIQPRSIESDMSNLSVKHREVAAKEGQIVKFAEGRLDLDDKDGLTSSQRMLSYLHVDHTCRPSGLILELVKEKTWNRVGVATIYNVKSNVFLEQCFNGNGKAVEVIII